MKDMLSISRCCCGPNCVICIGGTNFVVELSGFVDDTQAYFSCMNGTYEKIGTCSAQFELAKFLLSGALNDPALVVCPYTTSIPGQSYMFRFLEMFVSVDKLWNGTLWEITWLVHISMIINRNTTGSPFGWYDTAPGSAFFEYAVTENVAGVMAVDPVIDCSTWRTLPWKRNGTEVSFPAGFQNGATVRVRVS